MKKNVISGLNTPFLAGYLRTCVNHTLRQVERCKVAQKEFYCTGKVRAYRRYYDSAHSLFMAFHHLVNVIKLSSHNKKHIYNSDNGEIVLYSKRRESFSSMLRSLDECFTWLGQPTDQKFVDMLLYNLPTFKFMDFKLANYAKNMSPKMVAIAYIDDSDQLVFLPLGIRRVNESEEYHFHLISDLDFDDIKSKYDLYVKTAKMNPVVAASRIQLLYA